MKGLRYILHLEEPVLATGIEGDPNSSVSLGYVPGGLVRGALVSAYLRREGRPELDLQGSSPDRRLFLDGSVRYLNAYPAVQPDGSFAVRTLPVPLSWRSVKGTPSPIFDFSKDDLPGKQTEPVQGFISFSGGKLTKTKRISQVNIHTQRDAIKGRPTAEHGAVFQYQALPAGAHLMGLILVEDEQDQAALAGLLADAELLLGGARTAGYGRVCCESVEPLEAGFREAPEELFKPLGTGAEYSQLAAVCLSDVLVRDRRGQFCLDLPAELERRLGVGVQVETRSGQPLVYARARPVGGFNRKWGLPLPQQVAIEAGSLYVLSFKKPVSGSRLLEIEEQGVGERRAEGFGRLVFVQPDNLMFEHQMVGEDISWAQPGKPDAERVRDAVAALDAESLQLAEVILRRVLRQKLEANLRSAVAKINLTGGKRPSSHALNRWRSLIRQALAAGKLDPLTSELLEVRKKDNPAWRDMQRTRLSLGGENPRLADWLGEVLDPAASVWNWLDEPPVIRLGDEGQVAVQAGKAENLEFRLRLLDGVLNKISRQAGGQDND
jgi:CRISPR-associated protein Csx10